MNLWNDTWKNTVSNTLNGFSTPISSASSNNSGDGLLGVLKKGWEWLGETDKNGTANWLTTLGVGGNLYGAYKQNKMAKKQFDLQKDAYNFNKMLSQRELEKQKQAQQNLNSAWANSNFNKRLDEEE